MQNFLYWSGSGMREAQEKRNVWSVVVARHGKNIRRDWRLDFELIGYDGKVRSKSAKEGFLWDLW